MRKPLHSLSLIFFLSFIALSFSVRGSNYYWVGGTGDWSDYANHWATSSGGLIFHVQEPTPFDDVFFDVNSFQTMHDTVSVGPTIFTCHNMDWTGAIDSALFFGYSSTGSLNIYGSLTLDTGVQFQYQGALKFMATSIGHTIFTAGAHLPALDFNGAGGSWTLQDSLNTDGIGMLAGTFRTNNNYIFTNGFSYSGSASSAAYLGTSAIDIGNDWGVPVASSFILDADSSVISMIGTSGMIFYGGSRSYHDLNFPASLSNWIYDNNFFDKVYVNHNFSVAGNNSFDTLYLDNPGMTITLQSGCTQTIIDTLISFGSCTGLTSMKSNTPGSTATISKASGNVNVSYFILQDITAAGGATFIANNSIVISNVNGWTVPVGSGTDLYWVGGAGNWSDPNHWSASSGGAGGSCIPTPFDNVFFDSSSFSNPMEIVNMDQQYSYCRNMDWTGARFDPQFLTSSSTLRIFGSLTMIDSMMTYYLNCSFESTLPGNTITSAHQSLSMSFNGSGGEWTLQDSLFNSSVGMIKGTFYSNNNYMHLNNFSYVYTGTSAAYLGTSVIDIDNGWGVPVGSSFTLDADSTIISMIGTSGMIFYGGSRSYHDLNFPVSIANWIYDNNTFNKVQADHNLGINGNNIFDTLSWNGPGAIITLEAGRTQTIIDTLIAVGSCTGLTSLKSSTAGSSAFISKSSGNVNVDYFIMQDITATGGATFTANNSIVISNVSGWTIPASGGNNLYWVGGTGNWSDVNHWSATSGGPGGSCVPTPNDNAFFDSASFVLPLQVVTMDQQNSYCHNMDWTGARFDPQFLGSSSTLHIFGSLTMIDSMASSWTNCSFDGTTPGNTITSAHQPLMLMFNGTGGTWVLQDSLFNSGIDILHGTFFSNNHYMLLNGFDSYSLASNAAAYLGTSVIDIQNSWSVYSNTSQFTLDADSTIINENGTSGMIFYGGNRTYHDVNFNGSISNWVYDVNVFDKLTANNGNIRFQSNNTFDTLYFNDPGLTVTIQAGTTLTVLSSLMANATAGYPISLVSSTAGSQSTISMPLGDTACLNYIYMQDQQATGGGIFYAGIYSSDISNNSGWQFSSCVQPISNVWPGDANYDLITDNVDILNIGLAFGTSGFVRPGGSNTYVAQPCLDWPSQFITGTNTKHADCDGNGIVNMNDTFAVYQNYGITHPPRYNFADSVNATAPDLYFQVPATIAPGSTITVPVDLGTVVNPASNIYGIAFTVNYQSSMIVPGSVGVNYNGSWLVAQNDNVHLEKDQYANNKIDLGFSRIDHQDVSGNGMIVLLTFKIANTASGWIGFSFSNIHANDEHGVEVMINGINGVGFVDVGQMHSASNSISVYPNPTNGTIYVHLDEDNFSPKENISINDVLGQQVFAEELDGKKYFELDLSSFPKGIYFLNVTDEYGNKGVKRIVLD